MDNEKCFIQAPFPILSGFTSVLFSLLSGSHSAKILVNVVTEYPKRKNSNNFVAGISDICRKEILSFQTHLCQKCEFKRLVFFKT